MIRNLYQGVRFAMSLEPQNLSDGSANGATVDVFGFNELVVVLVVGSFGGTSPTLNVKVQNGSESDGSDAADVSGASFTQVTTTNDQDIYVGVIRQANFGNRYYRAVSTIGGTGPTGEYVVGFALGGSREAAVSQVNALGFELNSPT